MVEGYLYLSDEAVPMLACRGIPTKKLLKKGMAVGYLYL